MGLWWILDTEMLGELLDVMKTLVREGMTMIVVTHEMRFARQVGGRIIFMDNSRIVEEGPVRKVFKSLQNEKTRAFL